MINAPSTEFVEKINNGDVPFFRMQLTTARGRTIWLEDGQFWSNSISFSEAVSEDSAFTVGSAVIGAFNFSLNNFDRSLDSIDFSGAIVVPFAYFEIDGTREYLAKGVYYISSHTTSGNIIVCTSMDAMKLLDQSQTSITYPITVQNLVETICTANGITLATETIPNGNFELSQPTDSSGDGTVLTDRQMLSYACQCIGCFAKMNELGYLEVKWFDFEDPVQITSTFDGKSLWTSPILVTGIRVDIGNGSGALLAVSVDAYGNLIYMRSSSVSDTFTINDNGELVATAEDGVVYTIVDEQLVRTGEEIVADEDTANDSVSILYGTDDHVIKIDNNPYINTANVATVCENVSTNIFSITFRPGTLPVLANPCLQAGDVLQVTDNVTDVVYLIPITSTTYSRSLVQNVVCAFENKEDADLRPTSSYNIRVSVENALAQAQAADAIAQAAQELAETSGLKPVIVSDTGSGFDEDGEANLTAVVYDNEMNEVDVSGTEYIYRWWITQDGVSGRYLNGGKEITVPVNDSLCNYTAGIYFETRDISETIFPFALADRSGNILTNRSEAVITARAAEVYG